MPTPGWSMPLSWRFDRFAFIERAYSCCSAAAVALSTRLRFRSVDPATGAHKQRESGAAL